MCSVVLILFFPLSLELQPRPLIKLGTDFPFLTGLQEINQKQYQSLILHQSCTLFYFFKDNVHISKPVALCY